MLYVFAFKIVRDESLFRRTWTNTHPLKRQICLATLRRAKNANRLALLIKRGRYGELFIRRITRFIKKVVRRVTRLLIIRVEVSTIGVLVRNVSPCYKINRLPVRRLVREVLVKSCYLIII